MTLRDLFAPLVPEQDQHKLFRIAANERHHAPARASLQATFDRLPRPDPNFIKDFQTSGFSRRIWELYVAAYADSIDASIAQPHDRPDFLLTKGRTQVWVEATTANQTDGTPPTPPKANATNRDLGNAFAVKLGSALYSKLNKRYWELPHVIGKPLVIAIAAFHNDDPLRDTEGPLTDYLYGTHTQITSRAGERLRGTNHRIKAITTPEKTIPAHFFAQPDTENISGIFFSNAGTIAKFDRMAFNTTEYPDIRMLRWGFAFDNDPAAIAPEPFAYLVGEAPEAWGQEAILYHNPFARHQIPLDFFSDTVQYFLQDGTLYHTNIDFHPFMSLTENFAGPVARMPMIELEMRERARETVLRLHERRPAMEAAIRKEHQEWTPGAER